MSTAGSHRETLEEKGPTRRVLLLTATLEGGGLERQLTLLATHLPERWRPLVWSAADGPFRAVLVAAGVPLLVEERRARFDPRPFAGLAALVIRHRPDIVHAWNWMPAAVAASACHLAGIPYVDGTIRLGRPNPEFGRPRKGLMSLAAAVVANSRAGLDAWDVQPPKGRVIYNAFDPERLASIGAARPAATATTATRPFTVVMTGRMHPHKDYRSLLRAARTLSACEEPGAWRFRLVGEGEQRDQLKSEAAELIEAEVVDFVAPGLEVLPVVAAADVGVLMTDDAVHAEGCSNSIMEYMACGLPVVCCDSGGNRELVTDGVSGFVVPPGDDSALARRLHEIRASGRAAAMGAAGRERLARDFTVARMVASYTSVYEACVGVRGVGPPGPAEQEGPVHR